MASQFEREIHEQPGALARLIDEGRPAVEAVARRLGQYDPHSIVIAARGSSDNAARYAQYLFGAHNRLVVSLTAPSLFTLYQRPPRLDGAVVLGISQSGQSPDIVAVLAEARRQAALGVAVTNDLDSPLAQAADCHLPLLAGVERAVAATKTYTNSLLTLALLSSALEGSDDYRRAIEALPAQVAETLTLAAGMGQRVDRYRYADHFVVIGRGFNYATAFEVALKLKETSYVVAQPYSSADFRHGPIALISQGFPVLLIAPTGRASGDARALLDELNARGAEVVVMSDQEELLARGRVALRLPAGVPEWLSPIVAVVAGQLWALALAETRGLDPDQPRGIAKVTRTR